MTLEPTRYIPEPGDWVEGIDPIGNKQTGMYWRAPFGLEHHEIGEYLGCAQIVGLDGLARGLEFTSLKPARTPTDDQLRALIETLETAHKEYTNRLATEYEEQRGLVEARLRGER